MKFKLIALLLLPLAFSTLAVNAQAKSHKIRTKMTGCLEPGTAPNTFVLNNITNGYTRRNTTGQDPLALARADDFVLVLADKDKDNLQKHVGQRVKISGWFSGSNEAIATATATPYGTEMTPYAATDVSEFKVIKVHKISGSCR